MRAHARRSAAPERGQQSEKVSEKPRKGSIVAAALLGMFLGLSLLKFGNPLLFEHWVNSPTNIYEFFLGYPWPASWAFALLTVIAVVGLISAEWKLPVQRWLLAFLLAWFGWQLMSSINTLNQEWTNSTLKHFAACVVCFVIGCFGVSQAPRTGWFWIGLLCGFLLVLVAGWEQHFGGLEATRRYFFQYIYPDLKEIPPGYLKKMSSNRIFGTLFYPNALAGAILLLLPIALGLIENVSQYLTKAAKWFLQGLIVLGGLACLYWSGSKGGWLLAVLAIVLTLMRLQLSKQIKLVVASGIVVAGLAGFFWKYSAFFQRGATSVGARFDYWEAALKTARGHPWVGTGPGTFFIPYQQIKRPESEPSRLVHNDYLEQASDSGVPGFLAYTSFMIAALGLTLRKAYGIKSGAQISVAVQSHKRPNDTGVTDWLYFAVWIGVLVWAVQGLFEFALYVPGTAWTAFTLLGWLVGKSVERSPVLK